MSKVDEPQYKCWVDSLNLLSIPILLFLRLKYGCKEVKYLGMSKMAGIFIEKLKLINIFNFAHIHQNDLNISSSDEKKVRQDMYREQDWLAIDAARCFLTKKTLTNNLNSRYDPSKVDLFLKQQIASEMFQFLIMSNFIKLFRDKNAEIKYAKHIVVIKNNIWRDYLQSRKKDLIRKIYVYPNVKKAIAPLFILIKTLFEVAANSFLVLFGKKIKNISGIVPKIGVLHAHGADLKKRSDYFWFQNSGIDPKRIIVYFKYHCYPLKEDSIRLVESYNMQWVDLLPWKFFKLKVLSCAPEFYRLPHSIYIKRSIRAFLETIKLFWCCLLKRSKIIFWQWQNLANLLNRLTLYESFFTVYNIKVHYGAYEEGVDVAASNLAAELVGGIDLGYQWSNFNLSTITCAKSNDIHFSWGPYYEKHYFDKEYYNFKYLAYIGYPYDYLFEKYRKKARQHRDNLLKNGVKFIVTFFDQDYPLAIWPKMNEDIKEIYRVLLNKVVEDPLLGFITKSKKNRNFWERPALRSLRFLAKKAEKTGRCLFLEGSVFPNEAAQVSDLVIGYGVFNTPVIEAALSGMSAITWDLQNSSGHPFYELGFNAIVFKDLETMMRGVERFRNRDDNSGRFGNYFFLLEDIDPFRDGRASERAGYIIKCLLSEFDRGNSRSEVLERAVKSYRGRWGNDKVFNFAEAKLNK